MRILFLIPTLKGGGAERAVSNITTHLPDSVDADILINSTSDIDFPTDAKIISLNMASSKNMGILYQFVAMLKRIPMLHRLKRDNHYTACISFLDTANIANILTGNRKCKTIISVRNSLQEQSKISYYKYLVNPLARILYNKADEVVAVSERIRKELSGVFGVREDKSVTIENGYDVSILRESASEALDAEDIVLNNSEFIVTIGRLSDQKGQWHLIRAFAEVAKNRNILLLILGIGPLETYLKNVAAVCGVKDKVIFKGYVKNPYKYISRATEVVMPSLYEGFPNALAEAVCLGTPCIATDFRTGAREILAPELIDDNHEIREVSLTQFGVITPLCSGTLYHGSEELEHSERELAKAILMLLENEEMRARYALKGFERREQLKIQNMVQKWFQLIEEL